MPPLAMTGTDSDARQLHRGVHVEAGQHSIAPDVGVNDRFDTVVLEFLRQIEHVVSGHLGPAVYRHLPLPGIERDHHMAGKRVTGVVQKAWRLDRRRADDDVADPIVEIALDGVQVPDAATELHRNRVAHRLDDGFDRRLVLAACRRRRR